MASVVLYAIAFTMFFWISRWVSLLFFGVFCNTSLITSLWSAKNCRSSRKFPLSLESSDSSWPRKANPQCKRNLIQSTIAFNWVWYLILSWFDYLTKTLWMYWFCFIRFSPFLRAWLWALLTPPTCRSSFSFLFQLLNPFVTKLSPPDCIPTFCLNR